MWFALAQVVARLVLQLFRLTLFMFGLCWPSCRCRLLKALLLWCWLGWILIAIGLTIQRPSADFNGCSINCLVSLLRLCTQLLAHLIILMHTFLAQRHMQNLRSLQHNSSTPKMAFSVVSMLAPVVLVYSLNIWGPLTYDTAATILNNRALPSSITLHLIVISFVADIVDANKQVIRARAALLALTNELTFYRRRLNTVEQQISQLQSLKLRYSELNLLFVLINRVYGTSLLAISIVYFWDVVSNAYWMFVDLATGFDTCIMLHNISFICMLIILLTAVCWHSQQSFNYSRQIGCLISKLVKPMGNKRYNDLVIEFSLQALHQRFVVTAKDFFTLNLHTLSGMFAAVVTYLVILLQFMFAEKSSHIATNVNPIVQLIMPLTMNANENDLN